MSDLELAMLGLHDVKLALELQSKLDFFLMIFIVLHVFTLKFHPEVFLVLALFLKRVVVAAHRFHVLF